MTTKQHKREEKWGKEENENIKLTVRRGKSRRRGGSDRKKEGGSEGKKKDKEKEVEGTRLKDDRAVFLFLLWHWVVRRRVIPPEAPAGAQSHLGSHLHREARVPRRGAPLIWALTGR